MRDQQTYANHVRWYPLVHFVIFPLLTILLFWSFADLGRGFSSDRIWNLLAISSLILLSFAARQQALTVQDRLIMLEERLRFRDLLSPEVCARAAGLRTSQVIALRFASDNELGELVERVLNGELKTSKEIKMAIKEWRADHLRA